MKKVYGVEAQFSTFEDGLWFDSDRQKYNPKGFGIKIAFLIGKILMPEKKFYKLGCWTGKDGVNYNPWSGGNHWFVYRLNAIPRLIIGALLTAIISLYCSLWIVIPAGFFLMGGYISVAVGRFGFYFGNKTYGADITTHPHYLRWMTQDEIGHDPENHNYYLCPSISTRRTRWV